MSAFDLTKWKLRSNGSIEVIDLVDFKKALTPLEMNNYVNPGKIKINKGEDYDGDYIREWYEVKKFGDIYYGGVKFTYYDDFLYVEDESAIIDDDAAHKIVAEAIENFIEFYQILRK